MNTKNSQIRVQARHLLDDNIFGKDWLKAALVHILVDVIVTFIGIGLFKFLHAIVYPIMLVVEGKSVILYYFFPILAFLIGVLAIYVLIGPINVGFASVYTGLVKGEKIKISKFFSGFSRLVSNILLGFMFIIQVALWSAFLVIPGIYVAYSYALAFHVKNDHPNYNWKQCFDESERLMEGNRWRLFKLQISHLGWFIVGTAFVFVGTFWAEPYLYTSTAIFYEEVKAIRGTK